MDVVQEKLVQRAANVFCRVGAIIWVHQNYLGPPELFECARIIWVRQNYLGAPELFECTRIIWVHQDGNEDIVSGGAESCKEIRSFGNGIYDIIHYIIH